MPHGNKQPWKNLVASACFFLVFLLRAICLGEEGDPEETMVRDVSPGPEATVVGRKPAIGAHFVTPVRPESVLLILDGMDVTPLARVTAGEIEYHPIMALAPGYHSVSITAQDETGDPVTREWSFASRHTKGLEEASFGGELDARYYRKLVTSSEGDGDPANKIEGNLHLNSRVVRKDNALSFDTNIRYLNQDTEVFEPLEKGFIPGDYLISAEHKGETIRILAEVGDVLVEETNYTAASLGRRGGKFKIGYHGTELSLFSVNSEEALGFEGGVGVGLPRDGHVLGASVSQSLFQDALKLKATYLKGEELASSSYNRYSLEGPREGQTGSFLVASYLFDGKLDINAEIAMNTVDWKGEQGIEEQSDKAVDVVARGQWEGCSYEAQYLYVGRDFSTMGNPWLANDRQGFNLRTGVDLTHHGVSLNLSRLNDNVKSDNILPTIEEWQGGVDYTLSYFSSVPISLSYCKSMQRSTEEPPGYAPMETHTDSVSGYASHSREMWDLNVGLAYSLNNDKSDDNLDSYATDYSLGIAFLPVDYFSIGPSFCLSQSKDQSMDVRTDMYVTNLDVRSNFLDQRLTFDVGGSYTVTSATDDSADSRAVSIYYQLSFNLEKYFRSFVKPVLSISGDYCEVVDVVYPEGNSDQFSVYFTMELMTPFAL